MVQPIDTIQLMTTGYLRVRPQMCGLQVIGRDFVELNYYRLEAGRFEDFVSYGLKSFAHEGVT